MGIVPLERIEKRPHICTYLYDSQDLLNIHFFWIDLCQFKTNMLLNLTFWGQTIIFSSVFGILSKFSHKNSYNIIFPGGFSCKLSVYRQKTGGSFRCRLLRERDQKYIVATGCPAGAVPPLRAGALPAARPFGW